MRDERYFSFQSQKFNFTRNKLGKTVITINDNKETFNTHKELASNDKETININEKTIKDDIRTKITKLVVTKKQIPILKIIIPFYGINVDNNESTSKYTLEHQNKDNDQEKVCTTVSQNAAPNKKENLKR